MIKRFLPFITLAASAVLLVGCLGATVTVNHGGSSTSRPNNNNTSTTTPNKGNHTTPGTGTPADIKNAVCETFSPDNAYRIIGMHNGSVHVIRTSDSKVITTFNGHKGPVYSVLFEPEGKRVLSVGNDGKMFVWRLSDTTVVQTLPAIAP